MGRYLDILERAKVRKPVVSIRVAPAQKAQEAQKGPLTADDIALQHLWRLTARYRANLIADGRDPAGARVSLAEWRQACCLDAWTFFEALDRLKESGRVVHETYHAAPAANHRT